MCNNGKTLVIQYCVSQPILPPPPSSGKERASRTSESGSLFSPKTPHTATSTDTLGDAKDLNVSHDFSLNDEPSSGDWFTPPAGNSLFEEPSLVVEATKGPDQHEKKKQEILSQFDVFTDLDPLGKFLYWFVLCCLFFCRLFCRAKQRDERIYWFLKLKSKYFCLS